MYQSAAPVLIVHQCIHSTFLYSNLPASKEHNRSHSFPNMYGILLAKVDRLAGKLISSKKTPKNSVFWRQEIGITSLWEDLEAKLLTPGQLLGYPWKVWGITVQTSYWEGRWHQNCGYRSPIIDYLDYLFLLRLLFTEYLKKIYRSLSDNLKSRDAHLKMCKTFRLSRRSANTPPILATNEQAPTAWFLKHATLSLKIDFALGEQSELVMVQW